MLRVYGEAYRRLYDDVYDANNHLALMRLYTHPDYMRRGFGSELVKWGIDLAKEEHLAAVSVEASHMGMLLYAHLGFQLLEQSVVQASGDTETATLNWMVLELQGCKQQPKTNQSSQAVNGS